MCVKAARRVALKNQNNRCYYCGFLMWEDNREEFASKHGISFRLAMRFQATAEHLIAQCEGGTDTQDNIVAACFYCNSRRHRSTLPLNPDAYRSKVIRAVARGKWNTFRAGREV
jgi:hypothetical protein